jgi:FK506-binding protein 9/10
MKILTLFLSILIFFSCEEKKSYTNGEFGLRYKIIEEGTGEASSLYQEVTVDYVAWVVRDSTDLFSDWKLDNKRKVDQFEDTYKSKKPYTFNLGVSTVLKGFDLAMLGMRKGEKRMVVVPPRIAYGEEGVGMTIPPYATLKFLIELKEIQKSTEPRVDKIKSGDGEILKLGDRVQYRYELWQLEPETKRVEASTDRGYADVSYLGSAESHLLHSRYLIGMKVGDEHNIFYKNAAKTEKLNLKVLQKLEKIEAWNLDGIEEKETDTGLRYYIIDRGVGRQIGSAYSVRMHCSGFYNKTMVLFNSSIENGKPLTVTVDEKNIIKGWSEALKLVRVGSKISIIVPPELGYGDKQVGYISPNSELRFDIHVIQADIAAKNLTN